MCVFVNEGDEAATLGPTVGALEGSVCVGCDECGAWLWVPGVDVVVVVVVMGAVTVEAGAVTLVVERGVAAGKWECC